MTTKLAIAAYADHRSAVDVISRLVHQGLSEIDIAVLSNEEQDRGWEQESMEYDGVGQTAGRAAWLGRQGAPSAVADECAAAAEAGQTVLAVRCNESNVTNVTRVLEEGPHSERLEEDREASPDERRPVPPTATAGSGTTAGSTAGSAAPAAATGTGTGMVQVFDLAT